jgi:hypothetical protein
MNSRNSSTPPSKDSIGAKAARRVDRSSRERSKDRKPGGQPGHKGSLTDLRARYDHAVTWGITTNRHRDWTTGNHPGYTLAKRLHDKADQVWTFTRNLAAPWTNNASEQALKDPKRHQAVSGYWHTLTTLAAYCRGRSYLVSARNHSVRPIDAIDAIHAALTGNPWLPTVSTA